jgi:MFS transporter, DHA1 family, tetracycline resistance protein
MLKKNIDGNLWVIYILVVTIIIDLMGIGLVFPIMPSLYFGKNIVFSVGGPNLQHWAYAISLASWPLGLLLGGAVLGQLSDKFGRKNILIYALLLTSLSYAISTISIYKGLYLVFILSRLMSGLVGGAFEIAQATVIDISSINYKTRNLGYISMAGSIGFMIGPIITSITTNTYFGWNLGTPFLFAMILSLVNAILIYLLLQKDIPKNPNLTLKLTNLLKTVTFLFTDKRVCFIGLIYVLFQCGWGFYGQGIALLLNQLYNYNVSYIGFFYSVMGLSIAICSLLIQPKVIKFYRINTIFLFFVLICGICLISSSLVHGAISQWIISIIASMSQIFCYTSLLSIISSSVSKKEQGKAMGAAGAGFGIAWFINDIMMGGLSSISVKFPITIGGIILLSVFFLFFIFLFIKNNKVSI